MHVLDTILDVQFGTCMWIEWDEHKYVAKYGLL